MRSTRPAPAEGETPPDPPRRQVLLWQAYEECECGEFYDAERYSSCYECFLERRSDYEECVWCERWHSPESPTCYRCRSIVGREEACERLRLHVLWRDGYACSHCGSRFDLQIDHILPCARGGTARPWNLQVLCRDCNLEKGSDRPTGRWADRRVPLLRAYLLVGRDLLTPDELVALRTLVYNYRVDHGYPAAYPRCVDSMSEAERTPPPPAVHIHLVEGEP